MKRRILAMALAIFAFFIFVGSPFNQTAEAVVGVASGVIAIIIATLAAMGITFVSIGGYSSLSEYVSSLFEEFSAANNMTSQQMLRGAQSGVNSSGRILLNNRFLTVIDTFAKWLQWKFSLTNNTTHNVVSTDLSLGSLIVYETPIFMIAGDSPHRNKTLITTQGNDPVYVLFHQSSTLNTSIHFVAFSTSAFTVQKISYLATGAESRRVSYQSEFSYVGNSYVAGFVEFTSQDNADLGGLLYASPMTDEQVLAQIAGNVVSSADYPIDIQVGVMNFPSEDEGWNDSIGGIVDIDAPWGISEEGVTDDVIPGLWNVGDTEAELETENEEVVEEQIDNTANYVSSNPSDYKAFGLTGVFPFCIPFDLYNFISCLAADPVAPSFTWRFYFPGICDEQIQIDLSPYNTVAQVVRTLELLLFIVGLAFVTRDKFLRG